MMGSSVVGGDRVMNVIRHGGIWRISFANIVGCTKDVGHGRCQKRS